jgi:hypothetical protein
VTSLGVVLDTVPPSLNNAYRNATIDGKSRRVLTGDAKKWKADAGKQIKVAAGRVGFQMIKKTPMVISISYRAPNVLVWDIDGKAKLAIDAAMEALGLDDRYVMDLRLTKRRGAQEYMRISIEAWRNEE